MMDWSNMIDKVDPNVCILCVPELTQGYVLQPTPDPFDRLRGIGIGNDGGTALEAKEYLQQHANYAELLTVVDRAFSVATIQEQHKMLKAFVTSGADVEALLESRNPDVPPIVVLSDKPSKEVYGGECGDGGYVVWVLGESKLLLVNNMTDVNKLLLQICKTSDMKVDKLKQLGKLMGVSGAYKLKKAELIDSITKLA